MIAHTNSFSLEATATDSEPKPEEAPGEQMLRYYDLLFLHHGAQNKTVWAPLFSDTVSVCVSSAQRVKRDVPDHTDEFAGRGAPRPYAWVGVGVWVLVWKKHMPCCQDADPDDDLFHSGFLCHHCAFPPSSPSWWYTTTVFTVHRYVHWREV